MHPSPENPDILACFAVGNQLSKLLNVVAPPYIVDLTEFCSDGIATGYGLDDRGVGVRVLEESRIFSSPRRPDWLWGPTHPMGTGAFSPGVKRQGPEADRSPPTSAEVKTMWIYTSTPPYAFMS
jgi:hypothetical protein